MDLFLLGGLRQEQLLCQDDGGVHVAGGGVRAGLNGKARVTRERRATNHAPDFLILRSAA